MEVNASKLVFLEDSPEALGKLSLVGRTTLEWFDSLQNYSITTSVTLVSNKTFHEA